MDIAINVLIESYSGKYLSGHLCGAGGIVMERANRCIDLTQGGLRARDINYIPNIAFHDCARAHQC